VEEIDGACSMNGGEYRLLIGKPGGKRKMNLGEIGWGGMD
jgi:hypothetical protein